MNLATKKKKKKRWFIALNFIWQLITRMIAQVTWWDASDSDRLQSFSGMFVYNFHLIHKQTLSSI